MKRYRLFNFDLDSRAAILNIEIKENWDEKNKELFLKNKKSTEDSLILEFGVRDGEIKLRNFKELGPKPLSIIAFHNKFFEQIRKSFVVGSYYPALTGACTLGERILNYLIISLRDDFKQTPEYKKVYNKQSLDNWDEAIEILESWQVLLPEVVSKFKDLKEIRNREAIHFNIETEEKDRETALKAIKTLSKIIGGQFAFFGRQPWFIGGTKGEFFIKKGWEHKPFIKTVYLSNCRLVGPFHKIEVVGGEFKVIDEYQYDDKEINDNDFVKMREDFVKGKIKLEKN